MVTARQMCGCTGPQAARLVRQALSEANCPDPATDAAILVELAAGRPAYTLFTPLDAEQAERLAALTARRASREPLQYIAGRWPFLDFSLSVGPGVLCPRADTEVVAEAAAALLQGRDGPVVPVVIDLCAGSGCLGLGVKRLCPGARLTLVELSGEALPYLQRNAAEALAGLLTEEQRADIRVVQADVFRYAEAIEPGSVDLIVANPPYLTAAEMGELQPEVQREPALALDGGPDGLVFYRLLAREYRCALRPGGALAVEIGWQQRDAVAALLAENGWREVRCIQDHADNDRCVLAIWSGFGE